ncbi:MAG TPA: PilZ domain-containing protein [Sphingomicrobium sp.]|nr:PilZ domain-containing protein [Sphingomicrobium sp.]
MNNIRQQIFGGERPEKRSLLGNKRKKGADADSGLLSISIPRAEARLSDSREGDRHRLTDEKVTIEYGGRSYKLELVNLSGGGAMVEGDFQPNMWDRVELQLAEGASLECVVRWIKNGRVGLEFAHETRIDCEPAERARLLQDVIARSFPEEQVEIETPAAPDRPEPLAEEPSADDGRGDFRHPLIWSGQIHYDFESTPVRLRNISRKGAMIECAAPMPIGAEPLLDLGDAGSIFARVSWSCGDQVGLAFQTEFDLAELAKSRPDLVPVNWDAPSYLKGVTPGSAPQSDPWQRLTVDELNERLDGFLKH